MQYLSLKKMYHINEEHTNKLYLDRFMSEFSKKLPIYIHKNQCFYNVNDEILNLVTSIYDVNNAIVKKLSSHYISPLILSYLKIKSLVEEVRSSNDIEGIYSTKKEISHLIHASSNQKHFRFYGQVKKYMTLEEDVDFIIKTSADIRHLYDDILSDDISDDNTLDGLMFRKGDVEVSTGVKAIHNGISGERHILEMMDHALDILNDNSIHFLIRIALFHYLFEYIHPFYDGNGRMGRFISCGYLSNHFHILSAFQLSIGCLHNRKQYYDAFKLTSDVRNKADLTVFIIMFLEIYLNGLKELKENIDETIDYYLKNMKILKSVFTKKEYELCNALLEGTLFSLESLTLNELIQLTDMSHVTIKKTINCINKKHAIIVVNEQNKPYRYSIDIDVLNKITS